jgi:hypothetical protein
LVALLMAAAAVALVLAVLKAEDGYEDETGFHPTPALKPDNCATPSAPLSRDESVKPLIVTTGHVLN